MEFFSRDTFVEWPHDSLFQQKIVILLEACKE